MSWFLAAEIKENPDWEVSFPPPSTMVLPRPGDEQRTGGGGALEGHFSPKKMTMFCWLFRYVPYPQ